MCCGVKTDKVSLNAEAIVDQIRTAPKAKRMDVLSFFNGKALSLSLISKALS